MTAFNRFSFSGFSLRPAAAADLPLAAAWTEQDSAHAGMAPQFWIDQRPGEDAYVLENGHPIFFIKLTAMSRTAIELHIQFDPGTTAADREARRKALTEGYVWLERTCRLAGITEMFFRSYNLQLMLFAQKRLGFLADPIPVDGEYILRKQVALRPFVPGSEES